MNIDSQIKAVEEKINALISPDPGTFLIDVKIKPGNHIAVFIDADQGVSIEKLTQYNRSLYKQLEGSQLFPNDDFSLEVSSPGLDEPLKLQRQYIKNIGRPLEIVMKDGIRKEGKLLEASTDKFSIEEERGHKKNRELVVHQIAYEDVKTAKIQIRF